MLNVERLSYLADWLEAGAPHRGKVRGFDISVGVQVPALDDDDERLNYTPACGTVCCIAGAATQFFNDEDQNIFKEALANADVDEEGEAPWDVVFEEAQTLLGLTFEQAQLLFVPVGTGAFNPMFARIDSDWTPFNDPKRAARVIRNLIETGWVDWDI